MYVCICKAVTDTKIKNAIENGASTRKQLHQNCSGAGSVCGKCRNHMQQLLDENSEQQPIMQAA